jgi:NAD-dependent dihydropyrimidine dehydrogenase PreA subunit
MLRIYILSSGKYGSRIVNNIAQMGLASGIVGIHEVPDNLPEFLDEVDEFVPENLPEADLILSIGLYGDINMIIPIVASKTGAKSIIVPIHDPKQIPIGLQNEIESLVKDAKIVFPKPFCTLEPVGDKYIDEFAETFGKPELEIEADDLIRNIKVKRGAPCGSTWFVADKLVNTPIEDAEFEAGGRYHNYPCLASMSIDPMVGDTLMHLAGYKIKEAVKKELGFAAKSAVVDEDTCQGGDNCNYICRDECPTLKIGDETIIIKENGKVEVDPEFCGYCGICVQKCPFEAIEIEENQSLQNF